VLAIYFNTHYLWFCSESNHNILCFYFLSVFRENFAKLLNLQVSLKNLAATALITQPQVCCTFLHRMLQRSSTAASWTENEFVRLGLSF